MVQILANLAYLLDPTLEAFIYKDFLFLFSLFKIYFKSVSVVSK